jgi:hypothetical protein
VSSYTNIIVKARPSYTNISVKAVPSYTNIIVKAVPSYTNTNNTTPTIQYFLYLSFIVI